ncbi:LysR family transcriptional regulator [Vibrio astriarenae]|uniref:LysR family transcriptional regulator n=1 Tax=Vibrio astriarenae TaxID=1481923 RepID=A0A7Z2YFW6_9VIBR|nr:LysR family transcriptional regulator [Vibrio astriarenae]QIA65614.1 LysR family transcriptional regulator [Vibrio astriarenae]
MNLGKVDLNLLVVLKHLLEEKHVSNAALAMQTSQPSVSRSLQKLRLMFEDELLVRTTHGYEFTPKAGQLKQDLDNILQGLEKFVNGDQFDPQQSDQTVRFFGLVPQVNWILPPLLKQIRRQAPNLIVDVDTIPKRHFDGLNDGSVHFVLSNLAPSNSDQNLYRMFLKSRDFRLLMSSDNPLAHEKLTPENLRYAHFGQISLQGGKNLSIEPRFRELGLLDKHEKLSTPVMLSNFNAAASVAEQTDLIFHLPTPFAEEVATSRALVTREVPDALKSPYQDTYLYWHKRFHSDPMCLWIRDLFRQIYHTD